MCNGGTLKLENYPNNAIISVYAVPDNYGNTIHIIIHFKINTRYHATL